MPQHRLPALLLALGLACAGIGCSASVALSEPGGPVNCRTMGFADREKALRFDVNVWYPAKRGAKKRTLRYPPWEVEGATRTAPEPGSYPLIVLSHPTSGNRFTYHNTAKELAQQGFVVAAPTHAMDNMDNMPSLCTWEQLALRVREIPALVDWLLRDESFAEVIDKERIGFIGFGAGATTGLILGGALPDCTDWQTFCGKNEHHMLCNSWARQRIDTKLCPSLPLRSSLADTRIKAVTAVDPAYSMLFTRKGMQYFYPRLLLATTEKSLDKETSGRLAGKLQREPELLVLEGADEGALMAPCPSQLMSELPEICRTAEREAKARIHATLIQGLIGFFKEQLAEAEPATLPAPPDLSPPKPEKPKQRTNAPRQQRRSRPARHQSRPRIEPLVR